MNGFYDYWGKASNEAGDTGFHLLAFHSLDVAAVAVVLLELDPAQLQVVAALTGFDVAVLRRVVPRLIGLHDLGKFTEPFQGMRADIAERLQGRGRFASSRFRHDTLGFGLWRKWADSRAAREEAGLAARLVPLRLRADRLSGADFEDALRPWMAAVLGHHGRPPHEGHDVDVAGAFGSSMGLTTARARTDARCFAEAVLKLFGDDELVSGASDLKTLSHGMRVSSWWLAGFTILCDWLGSDTVAFPYASEPRPLEAYWEESLVKARSAVERSGLVGSRARPFRGIGDLFPGMEMPTPLQESARSVELAAGPQLFVLEDLTGAGKTEAALILAQRLLSAGKASGLYFGLPTMATANAMEKRVRPLLAKLFEGPASFVLAHSGPRQHEAHFVGSASQHPDDYGPGEEPTASASASTWVHDNRKKALLAHVGVGTIDQAFLAALQSRHAALRLLGLHRHVLVVDEVHACDAYMLEILAAVLRLHASLGGSAILLSATLPLHQRRKLAAAFAEGLQSANAPALSAMSYPLLTAVSGAATAEQPVAIRKEGARSLPVVFHQSSGEVVDRLVAAVEGGACACWVRNSVADAVEGARRLAQRLGWDKVLLFHARFPLGDRLNIEGRVLASFGKDSTPGERRGRVVVATQVVEQSLDIDFDVLVTDLCPVDLVIQRAGRLQRHARRESRLAPVLELCSPIWVESPPSNWLTSDDFKRTALVYDNPAELWRTAGELGRRGALRVPDDTRQLIEAVFDEQAEVPAALQVKADRADGKNRAHASVAQTAVLRPESGYLRTGTDWSDEARVATRLGEPTVTLRMARVTEQGVEAWAVEAEPSLRWAMSQVRVARRHVTAAPEEEAELRAQAEATMPFVDDDMVTLLFHHAGGDAWVARGLAPGREPGSQVALEIHYSPQLGLEFRKAG
jgi:CRISPR-associated endonuclease/helicase Cas3